MTKPWYFPEPVLPKFTEVQQVFIKILDSGNLELATNCLSALDKKHEAKIRRFNCEVAKAALGFFQMAYPNDDSLNECWDIAKKFANNDFSKIGEATNILISAKLKAQKDLSKPLGLYVSKGRFAKERCELDYKEDQIKFGASLEAVKTIEDCCFNNSNLVFFHLKNCYKLSIGEPNVHDKLHRGTLPKIKDLIQYNCQNPYYTSRKNPYCKFWKEEHNDFDRWIIRLESKNLLRVRQHLLFIKHFLMESLDD